MSHIVTTVKNLGARRFLPYLMPKGRYVEANEIVSMRGDLSTILSITSSQLYGLMLADEEVNLIEVKVSLGGRVLTDLATPVDVSDAPTKGYVDDLVISAVPAGSVTNTKLADVPTATIKGRATAGTGSPEDLTPTQGRSVLGLGNSAVKDVGTSSTQVAAGNDSRFTDTRVPTDSSVTNAKVANAAAIAASKIDFTGAGTTLLNAINADSGRVLKDGTGETVVGWQSRQLLKSSTQVVIDWYNLALYDAASAKVLDWSNSTLITGGNVALDWNARTLSDDDSVATLDWQNSQLTHAGYSTVNWSTQVLSDGFGAGALSIDWLNRLMYDSTNVQAFDWSSRCLLNATGDIVGNWAYTTLNSNDESKSVDWNARIAYDTNVVESLNWSSRVLLDSTNQYSAYWENRILVDSIGNSSVRWEDRQLVDGALNVSVDWVNRYLVSGGTTAVDWVSKALNDGDGTLSMQWGARQLINSNGTIAVLDYTTQAAAIADATSLMDIIAQFNDLLAKLRTYGLIAT